MMKKVFLASLMVAFVVVLGFGYANATVQGQCVNCHTMHNSQNGTVMTFDSSETPNGALVRGDCIGCHGQDPTGTANIITNIPQVLHAGTTDLAGGNFAYLTGNKSLNTGSTSSAGHNVTDVGVAEGTLTAPPGDEQTTGITPANFTCSGALGCHGTRVGDKWAGIRYGHHGDDSVVAQGAGFSLAGQGGTVPTSFRFLLGVYGSEDPDWQATSANNDHNEYYGVNGGGEVTGTAPPNGTMSGLCAECHGNFHGAAADIGSASPWIRHPTDIVLPNSGEYSVYNIDGGGTYSLEAPVARPTFAANGTPSATVNEGDSTTSDGAIVMCLSCHRAHATPEADILRWDYTTIESNSGTADTGCFTCHTTKNAD